MVLICAHRSDPEEFWVPLIEKAVAKLGAGGYSALATTFTFASVHDALNLLTGYVGSLTPVLFVFLPTGVCFQVANL